MESSVSGLPAPSRVQALSGFRQARLPGAYLEVTACNDAAVRLYRRLGFRCRKTVYKMVEVPAMPVFIADCAL